MRSRPYLLEVQSGGNSADSTGVMAAIGLLVYIGFMVRLLTPLISQINFFGEDGNDNIVVVPTKSLPDKYSTPGFFGVSPAQTAAPIVVVVATSSMTQTPYPTYTPYPSITPFSTPNNLSLTVQYSYYWPPLLGPNCHPENLKKTGGCKDVTASGLPWSHYRGRGVAIPLVWAGTVPLFSIVRVLSPVDLIGDYLVLDYCGACTKSEYPDLVWLDFLDDTQRLQWSADMQVEILPPGSVVVEPLQ